MSKNDMTQSSMATSRDASRVGEHDAEIEQGAHGHTAEMLALRLCGTSFVEVGAGVCVCVVCVHVRKLNSI